MGTTDTPTRSPITDEQVEAINWARTVLKAIANDATDMAWYAPSGVSGEPPYAQHLGRLAGVATMAADNLFDVLNLARAYGVADLTDEQVHNRPDDERDV